MKVEKFKRRSGQPIIFGILLGIGIFLGMWLAPSKEIAISGKGNRLTELMGLIEGYYVDTVNTAELEEQALANLLKKLDPHSIYIPHSDVASVNEPLDGEFDGIGVEFNLLDDTLYVVNVIPDGPSFSAGLQAGDRIITVNDTLFSGTKLTNDRVLKNLKGKRGTTVKVGIKRYGIDSLLAFEIIRGIIPMRSVDASFMIDSKTGYIKLLRFAATTGQEVREALQLLNRQGMKNLIFDMRGNPGGYMSAAIEVADEFLDGRKLIVYTEGRTQNKKSYRSGNDGNFEKGKLIILMDEQSASASEIVAGAVQDWDRGLIIGRRSYGKGLVQEPFQLRDNSIIRLTIARYYTPSGRSIQKPYSDGYDEYQMELYQRYEHGEMDHPDSMRNNDSLKFTTPAGRTVYGGGGVYPDLFVGLDTAYHVASISQVYQAALHRRFVYQYADANREKLKSYKTPQQFVANFRFAEKDKKEFLNSIRKSGITIPDDRKEATLEFMFTDMRSLLARQLFDVNAFYMVNNQTDLIINRALNALNDYDKLLKGN